MSRTMQLSHAHMWICWAFAYFSAANASVVKRIVPELDPKSDKKFFGPPFPADYPDDDKPHKVAHAFAGDGKTYPEMQGQAEYDKDYVKDENDDSGEWAAQHEYDELRSKLARDKADVAEALRKQEEEAKNGRKGSDGEDPLPGSVEKAKKDLAKAEANMKICQEELAKAKAALEEALERDKRMKAGKMSQAEHAESVEARVAEDQDHHEVKSYDEEVAELKQTEADLDKAELRLRRIRGGPVSQEKPKSGSRLTAMLSFATASLLMLIHF